MTSSPGLPARSSAILAQAPNHAADESLDHTVLPAEKEFERCFK